MFGRLTLALDATHRGWAIMVNFTAWHAPTVDPGVVALQSMPDARRCTGPSLALALASRGDILMQSNELKTIAASIQDVPHHACVLAGTPEREQHQTSSPPGSIEDYLYLPGAKK